MSKELIESGLLISVGAFFLIHCFRAGRRELRNGVAEGLWSVRHQRGTVGYAITIALTFSASVMGAVFLAIGAAMFAGWLTG
jgi:hypothetical protein